MALEPLMRALPPHLRSWERELAIFPREIALALGGLVSRLTGLLGDGSNIAAKMGEPDGYDGIARRGPYERLLTSEWMLLEEAPDEFLRRVVSHEHAFAKPSHTRAAETRRSIVLFDTSADQLGAPRLAHLAFLVLLSQRAASRGAVLEWGVLQEPASLRAELTPATVLELLRSRGLRPVRPRDAERWAATLGARPSERWVVGPPSIEQHASRLGASLISVAETLEPEPPSRLVVRASTSPTRKPKEVTLDVPESRAAVRLLRDPFGAEASTRAPTSATFAPGAEMVFSAHGRLLYVRTGPSAIVSVPVPNSPRAVVGPPVTYEAPADHVIVAAGYSVSAKRTLIVSRDALGQYVVHRSSKRGTTATSLESFRSDLDLKPLPRLQPLGIFGARRFGFLGDGGKLLELREASIVARETGHILRSIASPYGFGWLSIEGEEPRVMWIAPLADDATARAVKRPRFLPRADEIKAFHFAGGRDGIFAYTTSGSWWVVVSDGANISILVEPTETVVGVVAVGPSDVRLLTLDRAGTRLDAVAHGARQTLLTTNAPVTSVVVSGNAMLFAYLTAAGELGIHSLRANALVARHGGGAP